MKPLLCVRHKPSTGLGVIEDQLVRNAHPWRYADVWHSSDLPDPAELSGLIVLGGDMNVDELDEYPFLKSVRELVGEMVARGAPVLGICLGAQVLTRAAGAGVAPSSVREIGFRRVRAVGRGMADPVLSAFAPEAWVFQWHEDACELPDGADLLMTGDDVPVQAFAVGEGAYGVQFHFETTRAIISGWCDDTPHLEETWAVGKAELLKQADHHLGAQEAAARRCVQSFLDVVAG